ncbi:Scn10a [Symbiodinium natans]|uniref:Scn10a protein n=1 Tax=Symbiodinium natans TaxID=878477 RepID=A0A812U5G1_9DINO|nr:Scn10a [Symbiodinium natans]
MTDPIVPHGREVDAVVELARQVSRRPSRAVPEEDKSPGGAEKRVWRRVREFWTQTELEVEERGAQTEAMHRQTKKQGFAAAAAFFGAKKDKGADGRNRTMNDLEGMKARARKALMKPQYDVMNFYKTEGCFQAIARSSLFDQLTVAVVSLNAIWIAVDTDNNDAVLVSEAEPVFQVMENVFCAYFFAEIAIRFCAFERKKHAFMDKWFIFDFLLVLNMVIETWILPLVLSFLSGESANTIDVSMLRMLRLVKLTRLSRMARVLRSVPELAIIVKAIGLSARSVCVFFLLWLVLIYVFAVVFRQLTDGDDLGLAYFRNGGPNAPYTRMDTLLMDGILADYAPLLHVAAWWCIMLFFVLLAAITIMYMLVGVLVEVVGALAHAETPGEVGYVASTLRDKMQNHGHDTESPLSKAELQGKLHVLTTTSHNWAVVHYRCEDAERSGASMNFEKLHGSEVDPVVF